jgi:hypothetical protein
MNITSGTNSSSLTVPALGPVQSESLIVVKDPTNAVPIALGPLSTVSHLSFKKSSHFLSSVPNLMKVGLCDRLAVCVSVPPHNFYMAKPICLKLGNYIMVYDPILTVYLITPHALSVPLCVYP